MIKHFLVTRFNLRVDSWETTRGGGKVLTDEWHDERFRLFETYCVPSVKNQTDQNFVWCIYFDISTSTFYRKRIEQIAADYPVIRLFYIDGIKELNAAFQSYVRSTVDQDTKFVITSRLDNDDLLHRDFINEIKQLFQPVHQTVIDVRTGYQLCIENKRAEVRYLMNKFNPFISLIEDVSRAETVLSRMHRAWEEAEHVIVAEDKRLWIELVHSSNKLNEVNRRQKKLYGIRMTDFGLNNDTLKFETKVTILLNNLQIKINNVIGQLKS